MNYFSKNLRFLRESAGLKLDQFESLGIKKGTMSNYELAKTEPKFDILCALSKFFRVSIDDFLNSDIEEKDEKDKCVISTNISIYEPTGTKAIPIVDVNAAAGICGQRNKDYIEVVSSLYLPAELIKDGAVYYCIRVKGDSMYPTLSSGSFLIIRFIDKCAYQDITSNNIYVVSDTDGNTYVKRLRNEYTQGFVLLISDNSDKDLYPDIRLGYSHINTIWKAELYITSSFNHSVKSMNYEIITEEVSDLKSQVSFIMTYLNLRK